MSSLGRKVVLGRWKFEGHLCYMIDHREVSCFSFLSVCLNLFLNFYFCFFYLCFYAAYENVFFCENDGDPFYQILI